LNAETFSGLWYINEPFLKRMEGIILPRLIAGIDPIPLHFRPNSAINIFDQDGDINPEKFFLSRCLKDGGGEVAVIPLTGTMSRFGMCGMGNEFLVSVLNAAANEPAVKAVVFKGHTPGGTVDSIEMLANAVKTFPKPIVGFVAGMVLSAGYFFFSQMDVIVMEDSVVATIGSIGVLMVHVDQSAAMEKAGLKVTIFRADDSVDKAKVNGIEPLTDELISGIQTSLNQSMSRFKGYVRRGRIGKLKSDEVFTGKEYKNKEGVDLGLADRIGSLEDAIKIARKL
jgi:ClpP class serine protease